MGILVPKAISTFSADRGFYKKEEGKQNKEIKERVQSPAPVKAHVGGNQ